MSKKKPNRNSNELRINEKIRANEVLVINEAGDSLGTFVIEEALDLAEKANLDLVEISPQAKPPVCRIMDYSKYRYERQKAARKAKKNSTQIDTQEIKFGPAIAEHDYNFKLNHIRKFISQGKHVKATVTFKGRENSHEELGFELLNRLREDVRETATVETEPKRSGRNLHMLLVPRT